MPADLRNKYWVPAYKVKGHYRKHRKGHSKAVAKANAKVKADRHRRAAKLRR